jgi:DNA-binding HxlR family transcriptional regulator
VLGKLYEKQECSAARALEIVGERWSLLILRDAMFKHCTRFSELERSLEVAPNILSKRLDGFVEEGIMELGAGGDRQYHLTPKGLGLKPVIMALTAWGDEWLGQGPAQFHHVGCGGTAGVELLCKACGETLSPADVAARPAPGFVPRRQGRQAKRRGR